MNNNPPKPKPSAPARRVMDMHAPGYVPPSLEAHVAPPSQQRKPNLKLMLITSAVLMGLAVVGVGSWAVWHLTQQTTPRHATKTVQVTDDAYKIVNDPLGLSFSVSKTFQPMSSDELKKLSPFFVDGYKAPDVNNVRCIISQTPRANAKPVAADQLGAGTYAQLKTTYPDIAAIGYQRIVLANKREAAELIVAYHDSGAEIKQVEVVATTDARTTFAFCISPASLYSFYLPKFNQFFMSLLIY